MTKPTVSDLISSVVVFLVALPLCMGVAVASGVPVASGLITGIVGGIVVGIFAGSPFQVSGPAAGLTVLIFEMVQRLGLPALGMIVMIAGLTQIIAGTLRIGQWFRAVSPAVIHGMLAGIGVLIFSSQFHVLVDDKPRNSGWNNLISIPEAIEKGLPIPSLDDLSARRAKFEFMKELEEIHEIQQEIEEELLEHVSKNRTEIESQQQIESLKLPAKRQQLVLEKLKERVELFARQQLPELQSSSELKAKINESIRLGEVAYNDLQNGDLDKLIDSQKALVASLEASLGGLKNHDWAAKIGLMTILILIVWELLIPKRLRKIPAPLIAIVVATACVELFSLPVLTVELPAQLSDGIRFPSLTIFNDFSWKELVVPGLMIALIASAETLLCATAVDQMHTGPRTKYDQELTAQGLGNLICGCLGALPMTGVVVRSAANVQAGAKTRWSAVFHGIWLLCFVVFLSSILRMVPTAALAGILVYTGYKLMSPKSFWHLWKKDRSEGLIFLATVLMIVATDLLTGVITGLMLATLKLLYLFSDMRVSLTRSDAGQQILRIEGAATFLRLPVLASKLDRIPTGGTVTFDFSDLRYIDHACQELVENWIKQHEMLGGKVMLDADQFHHAAR
jgi:MFS superfamily sulfate permease-like transporter